MTAGEGRHRATIPADGQYDLTLVADGSLYLLSPKNEPARIWCIQNARACGLQSGPGYLVEARFVEPILALASAAELTVDWR